MEVITITSENQHLQEKLIGGRTVTDVLVGNGEKYLTVRDDGDDVEEEEVISLESLLRDDLDEIAEKLELDPTDYRTKTLIADALREEAESKGLELNTLIE